MQVRTILLFDKRNAKAQLQKSLTKAERRRMAVKKYHENHRAEVNARRRKAYRRKIEAKYGKNWKRVPLKDSKGKFLGSVIV